MPGSVPSPYHGLDPDTVLAALETAGWPTSGSLLALNSYENRVYQVGLADGGFVVAKFYRPGRWTDAAILEEHAFALELAAAEVPVVAPLPGPGGETLLHHGGFRFAVYPRRGGRAPELDDPDTLRRLGRFLGRLHGVGAAGRFGHRPRLGVDLLGEAPLRFLCERDVVPAEVRHNYCAAAGALVEDIADRFQRVGPLPELRLHGDFHPGNILWTDQGPHLVDLDDCLTGPAIQDLWMLLSGSREDMEAQLRALLQGYTEFTDFDPLALHLVEALRGLRMIHYCAWLARRWHDPAFPRHFPWFGTPRYWEEQIIHLREQCERLAEPPLRP